MQPQRIQPCIVSYRNCTHDNHKCFGGYLLTDVHISRLFCYRRGRLDVQIEVRVASAKDAGPYTLHGNGWDGGFARGKEWALRAFPRLLQKPEREN